MSIICAERIKNFAEVVRKTHLQGLELDNQVLFQLHPLRKKKLCGYGTAMKQL